MKAVYTPTTGMIRIYKPGHDYKARDLYMGVVSINWINDDTVLLFGGLTRQHNQKNLLPLVFATLKDLGVSKVQIKRAKGHRVPGGKLIAQDGVEDTWEVRL